jgi:phthiocerol/phenolphthiocerol synthesis type-I polyketide synthase E
MTPEQSQEATSDLREDIAIVGMAGRFPGARDVFEFWNNLRDGVESIRTLTVDELRAAGVDEPTLQSVDYVAAGALLEDADCFDAPFFGIAKREAEIMDPQHRVFLESAWSALEHAGYDPETYEGAIGVFGGVAPNTYLQNVLLTRPDIVRVTGRYPLLIGSEREYAVTRVAFKLGLTGPAISVNTACSTSGVALHLACQSVLSGECDMALVGGARVKVPLTSGYAYEQDGILSADGHCRAFDADATGTVVGSGVAMVVINCCIKGR